MTCLEKHNNPKCLQPTVNPKSLTFRWQLWGWAPFCFPSLIFSLDLTGTYVSGSTNLADNVIMILMPIMLVVMVVVVVEALVV